MYSNKQKTYLKKVSCTEFAVVGLLYTNFVIKEETPEPSGPKTHIRHGVAVVAGEEGIFFCKLKILTVDSEKQTKNTIYVMHELDPAY